MKIFSVDYLDDNGMLANVILFAKDSVQALSKVCNTCNPSAIFNATEVLVK